MLPIQGLHVIFPKTLIRNGDFLIHVLSITLVWSFRILLHMLLFSGLHLFSLHPLSLSLFFIVSMFLAHFSVLYNRHSSNLCPWHHPMYTEPLESWSGRCVDLLNFSSVIIAVLNKFFLSNGCKCKFYCVWSNAHRLQINIYRSSI